MKKLFLIPLMALMCGVMAFAADQHVTTIDELKAAIADASVETIYLDNNINYEWTTTGEYLNIKRSVTIDGQGNTLSGYGTRAATPHPTIAINQGGSSDVDVVIKNITISNPYNSTINGDARPIEARGHIHSITLLNCTINCTGTGNHQGLTIGGNQATNAIVNITNTTFNLGNSAYCYLSFNPATITAENSTFNGWCSFYFKGQSGSAGSRGTVLNANNCNLNNPNVHTGATNGFGAIVLEDDGIEINVTNSTVVATCVDPTNAPQSGVNLSTAAERRSEEVVVNIDATTQAQTTTTDDVPVLEASSAWVAAAETGKISIQHNVPAAKTNLTSGLRDNLYNGKMGTICVAKNVTGVSGATFYTVSYVELQSGQPYHLYFDEKEDNTTLEAGVPYVFIANSDKITGTFADEDPVSAGWAGTSMMYGNLYATARTFNNAAALDPYYVINNNRFYLMGDNVTIPVGRAFVDLSEVPTEDPTPATDPAFAPRRICLTNGAPQTTTAVENTEDGKAAVKVLRNGQVLILRGEQMFDVTGRVVE